MKTLLVTLMAAAMSVSAADSNPKVKKASDFPLKYDTNALRVTGSIGGWRVTPIGDATTRQSAVAIAAVPDVYRAKEWNFESAYVLRTEDLDKYRESVSIGGNYFLTKGVGFHAAVALNDLQGQGIDLVEFGPTARLTLGNSPAALLFGVGAEHRFVNDSKGSPGGWAKDGKDWHKTAARAATEDSWAVYAEVGLGYRLAKHLDVFGKIRGVRPTASSKGEHIAIILGASIPFTL